MKSDNSSTAQKTIKFDFSKSKPREFDLVSRDFSAKDVDNVR